MNDMDWEIVLLMVKVADREGIDPLTFINLETSEVSIPRFLSQMDQAGAITKGEKETIERILESVK
jgi:hypothetical protein